MRPAAPAAVLDASAVGLSGLCLVHCLALPILAAVLPIAGVIAEAEWMHRVFVAAALPISGLAIMQNRAAGGGATFPIVAVTGLALLCAAAFVEPLHDVETPLTILGAITLASAHIWRWTRHNYSDSKKGNHS